MWTGASGFAGRHQMLSKCRRRAQADSRRARCARRLSSSAVRRATGASPGCPPSSSRSHRPLGRRTRSWCVMLRSRPRLWCPESPWSEAWRPWEVVSLMRPQRPASGSRARSTATSISPEPDCAAGRVARGGAQIAVQRARLHRFPRRPATVPQRCTRRRPSTSARDAVSPRVRAVPPLLGCTKRRVLRCALPAISCAGSAGRESSGQRPVGSST